MRYLISGGGTGGHIYPAIAIAQALKAEDPEAEFLFVGAQGRMEMEKVPAAGYAIEGLWISGFQRGQLLSNLLLPLKLLFSFWRAWRILRRFRPAVVIGVGGYASAAVLKVAQWAGYPTLLHEQNSHAGLTNRQLAKGASRICVAYPNMGRFFPEDKLQITGNPIRSDIAKGALREEAAAFFGLQADKPCLLVIGGSLGARTLNEAMAAAWPELLARTDLQLIWQTGKFYQAQYGVLDGQVSHLRVLPFLERMDLAYALADVVISRAGALSVSELCLAGKASILVPSPNVAEDHQTANARALVEDGAALLVKDVEAKTELWPQAQQLLADAAQRQALAERIRGWAKTQAARDIAQAVLELAR